jgi:hypothetical protein
MSTQLPAANNPDDLTQAGNPAESTDSRRALLLGMGTLAAGAILASSRQAQAGPLTPPAGPVTSTGVTLQQINDRITTSASLTEPRTAITPTSAQIISQPGSYYLTANRSEPLIIQASDVVIDLNGFTLTAPQNLSAIVLSGQRITVRNGKLVSRPNTLEPTISVTAALRNIPSQITLTDLEIATHFVAIRANEPWFVTIRNVSWLVVANNQSSGGIRVGNHSTIINCTGINGTFGIITGEHCLIKDCNVSRVVGGDTYTLGRGSSALNCVAEGGRRGFELAASACVEACSAIGYTDFGIRSNGNARISRCQITGGLVGIQLDGGGNRVEQCKIGNAFDGIVAESIDTIVDNSFNAAGLSLGRGIVATGFDGTYIAGNYLYAFETGIVLSSTSRSLVTGNRLSRCTTPISGSGVSVGPLVNNVAALTNPASNFVAS